MKTKRILVPTDFSVSAWNALHYGMELYKEITCTFYLVHINPISVYEGGEAAMYGSQELLEQSLLKESKEKLNKLFQGIKRLPFNPKHTFHTSVHYGHFTDQIEQEVKDKNIDLIIMGTKGSSGIKAVSLGSNTGNVLTKVKCHLLVVPENARYHKPKEIVFPTDYQLDYPIIVLEDMKELVLLNHSTIRFLYVSPRGEELTDEQIWNQELLSNYFDRTQLSFHEVTEKKLETAVQSFTESGAIDMMVMVAKNLSFLQRILFRPTVEKISFHTKIPFLILHE